MKIFEKIFGLIFRSFSPEYTNAYISAKSENFCKLWQAEFGAY